MGVFVSFLYKTFLYTFAGIGVVTTGVFFAMQFDLLNVRGNIDDRNQFFIDAYTKQQASLSAVTSEKPLGRIARIVTTKSTPADVSTSLPEQPCLDAVQTVCSWEQTTEWAVIKAALSKDASVLRRVETETGVPARIIAAVVLPEQARFFSSNREVFKRWFEPMKLLGSLSQFSLGVSGIKQETVEQVEAYVSDKNSPFYPGDNVATLIAYPSEGDKDEILYNRLTNEDDHYYSYLYTALFVKEIMAQWERAGYGSSLRPEIIVTLFNLGFKKSAPKATPEAGGASLRIGNTDYTYGTLGGLFYYSTELQAEFPS